MPYHWKRWGSRLRDLRDTHKLSQEQLARKLKVHRVTIARLERGTRKPSVEMLDSLADVFGISLSTLMRLRRPR